MASGNRRWGKKYGGHAEETAVPAEGNPLTQDCQRSRRFAAVAESRLQESSSTKDASIEASFQREAEAVVIPEDVFSVLMAEDVHELMPGLVHLRRLLSPGQQQALLDIACEVTGRARFTRNESGGWYRKIDAFENGGPARSSFPDHPSGIATAASSSSSPNAQMLPNGHCDWQLNDGTKARFWDRIELAFPSPFVFRDLGAAIAGLAAQRFPAELVTATKDYNPRVGALNFYSLKGRMNWHVDDYNFAKKEQPIVMACLGHAADFGYKVPYDTHAAERRVRLESGDAIVFGGAARDMPHALLHVHPGTCPGHLKFPYPPGLGRISVTWRDVGEEDGLVFNSDQRLGLVHSEHSLGRYRKGSSKSHAQSGKGQRGKGKGRFVAGKETLQDLSGKGGHGRFASRTK